MDNQLVKPAKALASAIVTSHINEAIKIQTNKKIPKHVKKRKIMKLRLWHKLKGKVFFFCASMLNKTNENLEDSLENTFDRIESGYITELRPKNY